MTDTTKRAELLALADDLDRIRSSSFLTENRNILDVAAIHIRRLAAQDQKPEAWLQSQNGVEIVSKHRLDPDASKFGWTERPLYLSTPPAAGWNEKSTREVSWLVSSARAFLRHFNPCNLAEDKSQQWQSLSHQCDVVERALRTTPAATKSADDGGGVNVSRDMLLTLISVLDCALGDTDPSIDPDYTDDEVKRDYPVFWVCQQLSAISHQPAPVAANASAEATYRIGRWLSAALEDPNVCAEMKSDINAWMKAGKPNIQPSGNASAEARLREALEHYAKEYCEGWCEQDAGCAQFDHDCGGCLARRALSAHSPASDCDKQGETTKSDPVQDAESASGAHVADRTGGAHPPTGANPSDRTADVTETELAVVLASARRNAQGYGPMTQEETAAAHMWPSDSVSKTQARAILDAFEVSRK